MALYKFYELFRGLTLGVDVRTWELKVSLWFYSKAHPTLSIGVGPFWVEIG